MYLLRAASKNLIFWMVQKSFVQVEIPLGKVEMILR